MEGIEYWVKITDKGALRRAASLGLASYKVPIVKVMDNGHDDRLIITDSVFCDVHASYELFLLREHVLLLSFSDALALNIKDEKKRLKIFADSLNCEIGETIERINNDIESGRIFLKRNVSDRWSDKVCDFKYTLDFSEKRVKIPDEIDLYNFFEKWNGEARCVPKPHFEAYGKTFSIYSILAFEQMKDNCKEIEYYISGMKYHAIRFKARGTFLVSERRYHEPKAKKGETK